jgi:tetratricopeptide (TPR) repeat protein
MVTGRRAFPARHGHTPPPAPREVAPELSADWERVILRCMEREPSMRPASAEAVAGALAGHTKLARARKAGRASRRGWWIGGAAALLLAGLAPWAWQASQKGGGPAVGASVNAKYLEALDLLDHAYRPGAAEKAIQLLEPVTSAPGATALVHAALGRAYFRQFRLTREAAWLEKAGESGERAAALDSRLASARVVLGRVYTQRGKSDLAAQELQAAVQLDARSSDTFVALAELYEKQGRKEEIEPNLQKAVDLAPEYWGAHASLGLHFASTGRLDKARQEFQQLIELAPDNPSAYEYLGGLYVQEDRYAEARVAYEKALQLAPSSRVYSNLGHVLKLEGNFDRAAQMFMRAIDLNPRNFYSWANLGSAYIWSTENKPKAPEAYRKAIALAEEERKSTPNDLQIVVRLAACYASIGDAKNSIPLLRQSIALDGEAADTAFRVGEAYELLQHRDEALRWIGLALKRGYSSEKMKRSPELALLRKDPRLVWTK